MSTKVRDQILRRQRRLQRRLSNREGIVGRRVLGSEKARVEMAGRAVGTSTGGVRLVHELVTKLRLPEEIDSRVNLLKFHLPYRESDHVLSMSYNLLAGGKCIEDLEHRRCDEAFLNMLGAKKLPDPTTAGDFCRRFEGKDSIDPLQTAINEARLRVWKRQPPSFFRHAFVDADGTIAGTTGSCKEGMDYCRYKKAWGYQALIISLANTQEVLFQDLRPASRPSHEGAADRLDQSVELLRRAGFQGITLRGDTDYSQTKYLDGWDADDVNFVFGYQASAGLRKRAEALSDDAWSTFKRKTRHVIKTAPRQKPRNVKADIVSERKYYNQHLCEESIAEFDYRPRACRKHYRIVVLRKLITHERGQKVLFPELRYFFYVTNRPDDAKKIVEMANQRCNQERTIAELKSGVHALQMPLGDLESNWAYTVIATLAWNLSRWVGLVLSANGRWRQRHSDEKSAVLKMRFHTFLEAMMCIPAQVLRTGRQIVVRLLDWNPWRTVFFRALGSVRLVT